MSFYEINLLVSTMLSEEEALTAIAGIESKVEKYGKAISEKIIDKKKLAYSIQKETEAWLIYFNFSPAEGLEKKEALDAVEKALKAEKNIIRYLIVKKEEPKPIKERASRRNSEKKLEEVQTKIEEIETQSEDEEEKESEPSVSEPKKKVQLEELDEILDKE
ncbi:MAG: 30S ribosomal protein S6 [Candidatus Pacebacteria bacterium]|nr:30S ribosomal protein S6 [Candidatus Paceibacterota bacterium]